MNQFLLLFDLIFAASRYSQNIENLQDHYVKSIFSQNSSKYYFYPTQQVISAFTTYFVTYQLKGKQYFQLFFAATSLALSGSEGYNQLSLRIRQMPYVFKGLGRVNLASNFK